MGVANIAQGFGNFVNGVGTAIGAPVEKGLAALGSGPVDFAYNLTHPQPAAPQLNPNGVPPTYADKQAAAAATAAANGSASQTAAADAAAQAAISAGYGGVIQTYDNELGAIPGEITQAGNVVNNQADSQGKSIDSAYNVGNSNLQFARNELQTNTQRAITKLGQQLRDSFSSYDTLIGNAGAGDSSANGQLSYALQKVGAQNTTDINNNEQDQMGQIGQQQTQLDAQHADQIQQLNTWKANQIISIGQQFQTIQQQIEEAKAGANKDELVALAGLNTQAVNQAVSALSGVEAQHQSATAAILAAVNGLSAPGNSSALSSTNYTPTALPTPAAPSFTFSPAAGV